LDLISERLLVISMFILVVTTIETLAYSTRLSGARVGLIASAISLFNTLVVTSRFSTMFQQPLTGKLIAEVPESANKLEFLENQFRILIGFTSVGVIIGILLFPTFISIFSRAIIQLSNERGSYYYLTKKWFTLKGFNRIIKCFRLPRGELLRGINKQTFPKRLFVVNVLITAVYTVGVLASIYGSLLTDPKYAQAVVLSSGIINGIATILLTLFIDPKASVLADQVTKDKTKYKFLKSYSFAMITSKFAGTILAQLIFIPAAYYVVWFAKWL
jgi:hypothetical protein